MAADPDFIFMPSARRSRKIPFSDEEIDILVSNVIEHQDILLDKSSRSWQFKDHQTAIWQYILQEINKVAAERRTMQEIRNKWKTVVKNTDTVSNATKNNAYDAMPLQQRLSHSSTTSNDNQQPSTSQEATLLQSQTITPTKIKVTRQGIRSVPTPPPQPVQPPNEEVCLRWNSHHTNMQAAFPNILLKEKYVDTTLVSEGRQKLKCHRMILSACSQYFEEVLSDIGPLQHPVLCMKDIPYWILKALCDFMYAGEVHIRQNKLEELLKVAEVLQIKGLAGKPDAKDDVKHIKQEIKEPIKLEIKEPQPIVKLVKEPLLPPYTHLLKSKDAALAKEKTPVKETPPPRQKGQPILTRSSGQKDVAPAQNVRQRDSAWREGTTHATRQRELPGMGIRQRESRNLEREEIIIVKKPGPKSKTLPQREEVLPKTLPPIKLVPQPKIPPSKPSTSKAALKSRARSHSYTEKQKELKIPLTKGNINDPLDLLEPVYEEIQKQQVQQQPKILAKISVPISPKKGNGSSKKVKKRRHDEEDPEDSIDSLSFQSRKGTRSRPNVKVPRFYDPSFDQPDATIVREPHTNQNEPLHSVAAHELNTPTDPFQSIDLEEIKVEPAELEESNLIDARGNIVSYMGHQEQEDEEIIGSYDSPIVNIKKEAGTSSSGFENISSTCDQSVQMNVTTVTGGRTSTSIKMIGINKDRLKVVDISKIQRGKSNVDQLVHTPVNNPGIKISNVQTVAEETSTIHPPSEAPTPSVPQPSSTSTQLDLQPCLTATQADPQPSSISTTTTQQKSKRTDKKIVPNPVAIRIKEERMDPDYLPSQSDLPSENQIFIKTEVQDPNDECRTTSSSILNESLPNPDQILDIIGVSKSIKKEILDSDDVSTSQSAKQDTLKDFRKIKVTAPKHELQRALSKRMAEVRAKESKQKTSSAEKHKKNTDFSKLPIDNLTSTCPPPSETESNENRTLPLAEIKLEPLEGSENLSEASEHPTSSQTNENELEKDQQSEVDHMETSEHPTLSQEASDSESLHTSGNVLDNTQEMISLENTPSAGSLPESNNEETLENHSNNTQEMASFESIPKPERNIEETLENHSNNTQEMASFESIPKPERNIEETLEKHSNNTQEMANFESIPKPERNIEEADENQSKNTQEMVSDSLAESNIDNAQELVPIIDSFNETDSGNLKSKTENHMGTENISELTDQTTHLGNRSVEYQTEQAEINIQQDDITQESIENEVSVKDSNTQEMLSIESTQNFDEKEDEKGCLEMEEKYQNYTEEDNYDNQMPRDICHVPPNRQEIDFTQDDFGQNNYIQENDTSCYEGSGNCQDLASIESNVNNYCNNPDSSQDYQPTNENGSSEINSAVANIPGNYSEDTYENKPEYDSSQSTYETEAYPTQGSNQQESQSAVDSLQQNEYEGQSRRDENRLPSTQNYSNRMEEDFILEGSDETRRLDEPLDESLLEDFEEDVEMREENRGPSPEKTLEMIVNDLNESLGDVRQSGTDSLS